MKDKLTFDLEPGEFILLAGEKYFVLDVVERKGRVNLFAARVDSPTGEVELLDVPVAWITVIDHPPVAHLAALLLG